MGSTSKPYNAIEKEKQIDPKFRKPLAFLEKVKRCSIQQCGNDQLYQSLIQVLCSLANGLIDEYTVHERLSALFQPYPELLNEFRRVYVNGDNLERNKSESEAIRRSSRIRDRERKRVKSRGDEEKEEEKYEETEVACTPSYTLSTKVTAINPGDVLNNGYCLLDPPEINPKSKTVSEKERALNQHEDDLYEAEMFGRRLRRAADHAEALLDRLNDPGRGSGGDPVQFEDYFTYWDLKCVAELKGKLDRPERNPNSPRRTRSRRS